MDLSLDFVFSMWFNWVSLDKKTDIKLLVGFFFFYCFWHWSPSFHNLIQWALMTWSIFLNAMGTDDVICISCYLHNTLYLTESHFIGAAVFMSGSFNEVLKFKPTRLKQFLYSILSIFSSLILCFWLYFVFGFVNQMLDW